MTSSSRYRIELRYGLNSNLTPVYATNDPNNLNRMSRHFLLTHTEDDSFFRCCVLLDGHFRVIKI